VAVGVASGIPSTGGRHDEDDGVGVAVDAGMVEVGVVAAAVRAGGTVDEGGFLVIVALVRGGGLGGLDRGVGEGSGGFLENLLLRHRPLRGLRAARGDAGVVADEQYPLDRQDQERRYEHPCLRAASEQRGYLLIRIRIFDNANSRRQCSPFA
jgi:hypothetical protein